jgi:hypothetical protein
MAATDYEFGENRWASCGQIDVERNHDKIDHRFTQSQYNKDLNGYMYNAQCKNFATSNIPRNWSIIKPNGGGKVSDERFIHYIFEMPGNKYTNSKNEVFAYGLVQPNTILYKGQAWDANNNLNFDTFTGNIYSFNNINNSYVKREIIDVIKEQVGGHEGCSAYMFVDVGKNFLSSLNYEMHYDDDPIFHVINSQVSLADSAVEGKDIWDKAYFYNNIHCWWYTEDITVPIYDTQNGEIVPDCFYNYMFHSGISCSMKCASTNPNDTRITQEWYDGQGNWIDTIYIASRKNNITGVNTSFWNAQNSDERSVCYHRKRSGDGFAIWFMEQFASILLEAQGDDNFCHTCGWGCDNPDYHDGYGLTDDLECLGDSNYEALDVKAEIRSKSFFVTGDWPAFCWAAYCHCNVIWNCKSENRAIIFIADIRGICY